MTALPETQRQGQGRGQQGLGHQGQGQQGRGQQVSSLSLRVSNNLLAGGTGCSTWAAGLHLAEVSALSHGYFLM